YFEFPLSAVILDSSRRSEAFEETKMARGGTQLFVGRLSKETKQRDLENVFYLYGKLSRCDIKYAYGFVEYEDARDAEEAMNRENNRRLFGSKIVVEYVRSKERGGPVSDIKAGDECFKCGRLGHWRSSCTESRGEVETEVSLCCYGDGHMG
ncbi:hypothetical protein QZH41_014248, partial [Actinostola sp. cb2023]